MLRVVQVVEVALVQLQIVVSVLVIQVVAQVMQAAVEVAMALGVPVVLLFQVLEVV